MGALASAWNSFVVNPRSHPLGKRDLLGTYWRIISWQLRSRATRGSLISPWVNDARLIVKNGQAGATGNLYFGLHEYADMAFFVHFLRKGDVFADIGANVGSYTILAAKIAGATVIAFEPLEVTAAVLAENVALNEVADRVTIQQIALGGTAGTARFTSGHDTMNHFSDDQQDAAVEVVVDTADAQLAGRNVVAMKIDVEGAEDLVFSAAAGLLAEPQLIAIEIETLSESVRTMIEAAGFVEHWYDPDTRTVSPHPNDIMRHNYLFLRNSALVADRVHSAPSVRFGKFSI